MFTISAGEKAAILVEALPYIKKFSGKTIVIKYGGHAMTDEELKKAVLIDVTLMKYVGIHPVLVHGGGPEITALLKRLAIPSRFVNGLRVTDRETMEAVEMALAGKINKELVTLVNGFGGKAVGLCGKDAMLFLARQKPTLVKRPNGETSAVDIGFVGEIEQVNPEIVETLLKGGYIPVIAPVAAGSNAQSYNINADHAAGELAVSLKAEKLVILTDVEGVLENLEDKNSLLSVIKKEDVPHLIDRGIIDGGMIPKIECCVRALSGGVKTTHILDGRVPHAILLEVFTDKGVGTMVTQ